MFFMLFSSFYGNLIVFAKLLWKIVEFMPGRDFSSPPLRNQAQTRKNFETQNIHPTRGALRCTNNLYFQIFKVKTSQYSLRERSPRERNLHGRNLLPFYFNQGVPRLMPPRKKNTHIEKCFCSCIFYMHFSLFRVYTKITTKNNKWKIHDL